MTSKTANKDAIILRPYQGMGDNILYRPFLKKLVTQYRHVLIQTSWPQMFQDIEGLKLISPNNPNGLAWPQDMALFSQKRNRARFNSNTWDKVTEEEIASAEQIILNYRDAHTEMISFRAALCRTVPLLNGEFKFDLPLKDSWKKEARRILAECLPPTDRPRVLLHRPTIRKEWPAPARNPKAEYLQALIDRYRDEAQFFDVVDIEHGKQWFDGNIEGLIEIDGRGIHAEIFWSIVSLADAVVCGNGFMIHMAPAVSVPLLVVMGGWVHPACLFDEEYGIEHLRIVAPDPFCHCVPARECTKCNKKLDLGELFYKFEEILSCRKR